MTEAPLSSQPDAAATLLQQHMQRAQALFDTAEDDDYVSAPLPDEPGAKGLPDALQLGGRAQGPGYAALVGRLDQLQTEPAENFGNWQHVNLELLAPQGGEPAKRFSCGVDVGKPHSALIQIALLAVNGASSAHAKQLAQWAAQVSAGLHPVGSLSAPGGMDYAALGPITWRLCSGMEAQAVIAPALSAADKVIVFGMFSVAKLSKMPGLHMVHYNQGNLDARFEDMAWRSADGREHPADGGILALRSDGCTLILFKFSNQPMPAPKLQRAPLPSLCMLADSNAARSLQGRIGVLREGSWTQAAAANLHLAVLSPRDAAHVARAQAEAIAALPGGCAIGLLLDNPTHRDVQRRLPVLRQAIAARGLPAFQAIADDTLRTGVVGMLQTARAELWQQRLRSTTPDRVEQVLPLLPGALRIDSIDTRAQVLRASGITPPMGEAILLLERGGPSETHVLVVNGVVIETRADGFDFLISVRAKEAIDPLAKRLQAQLPSWSNPRLAALNELRGGALVQAITLAEAAFRLTALDASAGVRMVGLAG